MKLLLVMTVMSASVISSQAVLEHQDQELRKLSRSHAKEWMQHHLLVNSRTHAYPLDKWTQQDLMIQLIEENLTDNNVKLVLNFVSKQHDDLLYTGYLKIFETIKEKQLKGDTLFELANQAKIDINRGQVAALAHVFPKAIWSLFNSAVSCIKNKGFNEYLYAGLNNFTFDLDRRQIATLRSHGTVEGEEQWRFIYIGGNQFYIKSKLFDEYLFAENDAFNFDDERRRVFTWMKYWPDENTSNIWALEWQERESFKIRNILYDEPLYPLNNDHIHDEFHRAIFTWIPKDFSSCNGGFHQCKWIVSDC